MTRVVEWTDWRCRRAAMAWSAARQSRRHEALPGRASGRRRDSADSAIITRMVVREVARRRAEGRLVRLGEREYELHVRTGAVPPER